MQTPELHVVFGAGQIGSQLIDRLLARGVRVRSIRRTIEKPRHAQHECVQADVYELHSAIRAAQRATVVYHCANAPYHQWGTQLLPLTRNIAAAAKSTGARLVALDNVYAVGATGTFDESTPELPRSQKGILRKQMADELREMHAKNEILLSMGRASDFFGVGTDNSALMNARSLPQLFAGDAVDVLGNIDLPHSWSYAPDVAEGLLHLGLHPELAGQTFHLPVLPAQSGRALLSSLSAELGHPLRVRQMPGWLLKVAGVFNPVMREFPEMMYQFENPFIMSDARIRGALGLEPTPLSVQIKHTANWLRKRFSIIERN